MIVALPGLFSYLFWSLGQSRREQLQLFVNIILHGPLTSDSIALDIMIKALMIDASWGKGVAVTINS